MSEAKSPAFLHCFVPHRHRLMTLIGFIRTHLNNSIIVNCTGSHSAEFISIFLNNIDIRVGHLHGRMEEEPKANALERYNSGKINILFVSQKIIPSTEFKAPDYFIQYDIPKAVADEIQIINHIKPKKVIIFLDDSQKNYINLLKEAKIESKNLPFNEKKIPNLYDELDKLINKVYLIYENSQRAYRELISEYVNHPNKEIFCAPKLPLLDVAHSFGISAPPKLRLQ